MTEIELVMTNENGEALVVGALDFKTGDMVEFCLPLHKDYDEWAKSMLAKGYVLCQMTIGDAVDDPENQTLH